MSGLKDDDPDGFGGIVEGGRRPSEPELKMWIAVRQDIAMSKGKAMIQSGHAFQWHAYAQAKAGSTVFDAYMASGTTPKACVKVADLRALERVEREAKEAGLSPVLVTDLGRTEFANVLTVTCVVFGPAYRDLLPPYLKRLQLMKDDEAAG